MNSIQRLAFTSLAALALVLPTVRAQDFINYRGTTGNGIYPGVGLLKEWPKEGPRLLWMFNPGDGWASPSVVDGKVYVVGARIGQLWTLDLDGNPVGQRLQVGSMEWKRFSGSRGVPLVKDGVAVVNAPNANYWGIDLATGDARWQVNAWKSFGDGGGGMGWGCPESPMLIDNKVILNTCSRQNGQPAFVALDIATGKTVWGMKTQKKYSAADVSGSWGIHKGRKLYFCPTWCWLVCLDADTGELLWEIKNEGETTLVPMYNDGYLLWGDSKGGMHMLKLSDDARTYKKLWSREASYSGWSQAAFLGNKIFTFSKGDIPAREYDDDGNVITNSVEAATAMKPQPAGAQLVCLDRDTGKFLAGRPAPYWPGHIIAADGMVYVTEVENMSSMHVSLIKPTDKGFVQVSSFVYPAKSGDSYEANANTAIYEGRLFIRYGGLRCFDLRADIPFTGTRMDGSGIFKFAAPPIRWGMSRNLGWKQTLLTANGSAPVAAAGRVFTAEKPHTLVCMNAKDGTLIWKKTFSDARTGAPDNADEREGREPVYACPAVRGTNVYATFPSGSAVAFDLDGNIAWTASLGRDHTPRSPVPYRDIILVPGKNLAAHDAKTGKQVWTHTTGKPVSSVACVYSAGEPAVVTDSGALLNLTDGSEIAANIVGSEGPFHVTADVQEGRIFAASRSTKVCFPAFWSRKFTVKSVALPAKTGESARLLWSVRVKGPAPATPPVSFGGQLYLVSSDRRLIVLDARTGAETARITLDDGRDSNPVIEPHVSVAGRRLYVQNVGKRNLTVVLQPGPTPSVLWQYGTETPSAALGFLEDSQFIRAGSTLWCMRGATPTEPRDPKIAAVEPQPFLAGADLKAPVVAFTDKVVPEKWLLAGPCYPSTLETNFLSSLGPVTGLTLSEGQSHRAGYTTITFRPSEARDFWKSGHSANLPAFDFTLMTSRKPGTIYAYTVIENDKDRYVEYNPLCPGQYWRDFGKTLSANSWLSGVPIDQGSIFLLKKGRHGLLIQAAVGKPWNDWGKIFMTPHFTDVEEKATLMMKRYADDTVFWTDYAKTKDEVLLLKP